MKSHPSAPAGPERGAASLEADVSVIVSTVVSRQKQKAPAQRRMP
jgi:hypothetical protein